jgi:ABC-2 type transport system ATP-binding protein
MDFRQAEASVREDLRRDVRAGIDRLADFADWFAADRDLLFQSVLLKRELAQDEEPAPELIQTRALEIVDQIAASYERSAPAISDRQRAVREAREQALRVTIPEGTVLQCQEVSKTFRLGGFSLRGVSFDAQLGRIRGVVGRNGNGKTTLFRLVIGELKPSSGALTFPALSPSRRGARQQIAYVPQELPRWYGSLRTNLHYAAAIHGVRGTQNTREVEYIVERLGLADDLGKAWRELSGGMKVRFALARALVWKPKLLVLDEPLANLDFIAQQVFLKDLRNLANSLRYPVSVLISSQHLHEIEEVSDDILYLKQGQVLYSGPVGQIGARRKTNAFELGGAVDLARLQRVLAGSGFKRLYHSGVSFVVTTPTSVAAPQLLRLLLDAGVQLDYFRDISHSIKGLFEEDLSERSTPPSS